jgi:membrane-associated PAP2 superfamily phosphatase
MNRTALAVVLALAAVTGLVFGLFPQLDVKIAAPFYVVDRHFLLGDLDWHTWLRDQTMFVVALFAAPPIIALVFKLIFPHRRMPMSARAAVFLTVTFALAPGVLANGILKDHWPRSRPVDVQEFKGGERFTPWWDPRGDCTMNCSFVSGEAAGAYWLLAPASLAPPPWRPLAYAAAVTFGTAVGVMRMAFGGHFFTDVVFAGVFTYLIIWIVHGLIYRWRATRTSDEAIENAIAAIPRTLMSLFRRNRPADEKPGLPGRPS